MQRSNSSSFDWLRRAVVVSVCLAGPWSVAQAQPAARVNDMHTCPLVEGFPPIPHVGGPILAPGVPTVLIANMPAAVVGNLATCNGPPDTIVQGEATVLIGSMPAARQGDTTAHGGLIVAGAPTVLIGSSKSGGGDLEDQAAILEGLLEQVGEDEAIRNALATVYTLIGDQHAKTGDDALAHDAYVRALAAIEPAVATAERDSVLVTYVQTLVLNDRVDDAAPAVAELERRGFNNPHFAAFCEHHGLTARPDGNK